MKANYTHLLAMGQNAMVSRYFAEPWSRLALSCLVVAITFASQVLGQNVLFRTDFDDGMVPLELGVVNHEGARSVVDGWYQWTPTSTDQLMNSVVEGFPDDVSIRTRVRLLEEPANDWIFVGVVGRDSDPDDNGRNYFGLITTDARIGIGVDPGPTTVSSTELDVVAQSIDMQFDLFGDEIRFTVWQTGMEQPLPQIAITDSTYLGGRAFLSYSSRGAANLPTVAFDFLEVVGFEACDADGDHDCDLADLNVMYERFGFDVKFDFDGDGGTGPEDISGWLAAASSSNNIANPDGLSFIQGDVNLDGAVGSDDLGLLLNNFGATALSAGEGVGWGGGDLDGSGSADSGDLGLLLNNFGHMSATAVAVPEPSCNGWAFLFLIVAFLRVGRRMQFRRGACSLFDHQP